MAQLSKKTACVISLTPVTDEPRVRRQTQALHEAGWSVIVVGYKGRSDKPPYWKLIQVERISPMLTLIARMRLKFMKKLYPYIERYAEDYYWWSAGYAGIYERLACVEKVRCDLVVAHDYFTAPIAARLADRYGSRFVLDCHEYSVEQYAHDPKWVKEEMPLVRALEKANIMRAATVTTVCESIAKSLQRDYSLPSIPIVVRNVPFYQSFPFRPTGEQIGVLYHGNICSNRGLEVTIKSVPLWRPEFRLVIRGPGTDNYVVSLRALAKQLGVAQRVCIEAPVPFQEIIRAANAADIGFFVQEDVSLHKRFALPNKFFDYIMAGTALCVADLPEMARIVEQYGIGHLVRRITPEGIAESINSFSRLEIDAYKLRSLGAAKELCWENESQVMIKAYERAMA